MLAREMLEHVGETDIKEAGILGDNYELEEIAENVHSYLVVSMSSSDSLN